MHTFKTIPFPKTSPRIEARKTSEQLHQDYEHLAVLFWGHCNRDLAWQEGIEERLRQIERKISQI